MQSEYSLHVLTSSDMILLLRVQQKNARMLFFLHQSITYESEKRNLRNLHDFHSCFFICKKNNFIERGQKNKNHDNSIANAIFAQRIISLKRPKSISGCFSTSFSPFKCFWLCFWSMMNDILMSHTKGVHLIRNFYFFFLPKHFRVQFLPLKCLAISPHYLSFLIFFFFRKKDTMKLQEHN